MKSVFVITAFLICTTCVLCLPQLQHSSQTVGGTPVNQPEFPYNVTVIIPEDNHDRQEGKLWIILEGTSFQHEIKLTLHSTPLRPGNNYSYYINAPYPVERLESVLLQWKKKSYSNLLGSSALHVKAVILEPTYVTGTVRTSSTKKFCADSDPVEMTSEIKYKFWISCSF